ARTICNQVATALQNARLFEETRVLTEHLEMRVQQRTAELAREHQRSDTLLRIITELSASLDLTQVLNRTLHVLGEYLDAEKIVILIDRPGQKELQRLSYLERSSDTSEEDLETARQLEQILGSWIVQNRQSILVDDITGDERWKQTIAERLPENNYHSALGVPLMSGAEALGCLVLIHSHSGYFSLDQLDLVQAATNQVSISVNNAELYRLIRDQAEDLGTMLRNQQIETSRSKAILESVADGVLVTDANRQITLFNESAEKILGMGRAQVLGRSMEHFAGIFGRATQSWLNRVNAWSQEAASDQPRDIYSERILLEDGRVISVHLAPVGLRSDFLGTVSIFQDITHQVEVERLKSEFVATVSHELRTPMTSIKGYVEILLMGAAGQLSEQQAHFLQIVKTNTERLAVLVNDLLDISQIESGRVTLKLEPVEIEELVEHSLDELIRRIQGSERAVSIEKEFQPNLPRVLADADRLQRVLENLLDNAYQYNLPGGKIRLRLTQAGDEIQVDIQDSGIGINPLDKEQIFERFFRGENPLVLGVAGTGLGLSIVYNIIQMHNGRIWIESSGIPGEGSTFSFTLPLAPPQEMEKEFSEWQGS
ncbi:MAG: GAF domain-containing protein, partial [Anaerolineales bacterium]|nr:GAF domain-containing protein [Anaerolineales bacterium]